jgi:hypothetical protein
MCRAPALGSPSKGARIPMSTPDAEENPAHRQVDWAELDRERRITAVHVQRCFPSLASGKKSRPTAQIRQRRPNGRVSVLVATGEAEIRLQQVSS